MKKTLLLSFPMLLFVSALSWSLEVTLTLRGNEEEILSILQCIREAGKVTSAGAETEDPLKVHIYSSSETAMRESSDLPLVGFREILVEPEKPRSGEKVRIVARVSDSGNAIDTMSVSILGTAMTVDMRDDGQMGDEQAGDGVWTGIMEIPPTVYGIRTFIVTGYDAQGKIIRLMNPDGTWKSLVGSISVEIVVSPPAEESKEENK